MKVFVLCKRRYTGKDMLSDRYGRLYELPAALALMGHSVTGLTLAYRFGNQRGDAFPLQEGVEWHATSLLPWPNSYFRHVDLLVERFAPDVIWASSDALHAVLADRVSARAGIPLVIDLYDDYEAFGLTQLPGIRRRYRRACARANALTVVTHSLGRIMTARLGDEISIDVIGNGISPEKFQPQSRLESRSRLGLPSDAVLVGSAGALDRSRGFDDLIEAFQLLKNEFSDVRLVVAGPRDKTLGISGIDGIIDLGTLPHDQVSLLFSALDVGVVCNRDSKFGRACYPMKLAEMVACGLPVVAAALGDVPQILGQRDQCLYSPGDSSQLMRRIRSQVIDPVHVDRKSIASWNELGLALSAVLERVAADHIRPH